MYSKDELTSRNVATLKDIAKQIGAKIKSSDNKETIIYAILDAQAETMPQPVKRKRARIAKTEDKVYTVKGKDGENFDVMKIKLQVLQHTRNPTYLMSLIKLKKEHSRFLNQQTQILKHKKTKIQKLVINQQIPQRNLLLPFQSIVVEKARQNWKLLL